MYSFIKTNDSVAEISVSYSPNIPTKERITINSPGQAEAVFRHVWDKGTIELQECFKAMLLNRKNQVLGVVTISKGTITNTVVDCRLLFGIALKAASVGIIICHNHPSGNTEPSDADIKLSKKLLEIAELMEINILDHIILTHDAYYSFLEHENLFTSKFRQ